jgi:leucyl/phenylalanyl-tRNA--protein transferase
MTPVYRLTRALEFPDPEQSEPDGLLAVGGDLCAQRLLLAYSLGIFPWYGEGLPILWHSPDPRNVLPLAALRVSRSLGKALRRGDFEVRLDSAFAEVIERCADTPRSDQQGTWITSEMQRAYIQLHELGYAHSAEAWSEGRLVGGLYGVSLGNAFFGESMFAQRTDASKVALVSLARQLQAWGFDWIDCQVHTPHLARLGAQAWPRTRFLAALRVALSHPTRVGRWQLDPRAPEVSRQ